MSNFIIYIVLTKLRTRCVLDSSSAFSNTSMICTYGNNIHYIMRLWIKQATANLTKLFGSVCRTISLLWLGWLAFASSSTIGPSMALSIVGRISFVVCESKCNLIVIIGTACFRSDRDAIRASRRQSSSRNRYSCTPQFRKMLPIWLRLFSMNCHRMDVCSASRPAVALATKSSSEIWREINKLERVACARSFVELTLHLLALTSSMTSALMASSRTSTVVLYLAATASHFRRFGPLFK